MPVRDQAGMFWRFARALPRFLRTPLSPVEADALVARDVRDRQQNFLQLVELGVYGLPTSPYLALLRWAGVEFGDLRKLVTAEGVEGALGKLYDAGVWVGLDEFKGQGPIERSGLRLETAAEDFDNPLLARDFEVMTGGSTGTRRRLAIDFELLVHDAAFVSLYYRANGLVDRPGAIWRPIPPGSSGLKNALQAAKMGSPLVRWFSPQPFSLRPSLVPSAIFSAYSVACGQLHGGAIPRPRYTPLDRAGVIAAWIAEAKARGTAPWLSMPAGNASRISQAALDEGIDISGTHFRVGGEPLTGPKYELIRSAGADTVSGWSLSEAGPLAGGCSRCEHVDEVHVFDGKAAVLQRSVETSAGETVEALHLTTLLPQTPKIMLNVNTGDYGVLNRRRCGCALESAGLGLHLHTIRNYEKLTAGGMHFVGSQIAALVEQTLPAAFGGGPTDYQFVEEDDGAATQVTVVVSPRVGELDEARVTEVVAAALARLSRGDDMMASMWRQGGVLRIAREEPYVTPSAKTPAVRVAPRPARDGGRPGH